MSNEITLSADDDGAFKRILDQVSDWSSRNQWAVGVAEMAAGAGLISAGIQMGFVDVGGDVLGTAFNMESVTGALGGGGLGAAAGLLIGGIGVVGMGGGIGIPAAILAGGAAAVGSAFGYSVGDTIHNLLSPGPELTEILAGGSLLAVGIALFVDGARRLIGDWETIVSHIQNGVIYLTESYETIIVDSGKALAEFAETVGRNLGEAADFTGKTIVENKEVVGGTGGAVAGAAAGAAVGTSVAASSVTVLGSQALGSAALSMGLVSAPVLPVVAIGAAGAAVGYGLWKAGSCFFSEE